MFSRLLKLSILFLCMASLAACAEQWTKPGTNQQDFNKAEAACSVRAAQQFPPLMRPIQVQAGYTTPTTTQCIRSPNTMTCTKSGGDYVPPDVVGIDDNEDARDEAVHSCLYQNGWKLLD